VIAVIMYECPDYSLVKWMENSGAVCGKEITYIL
jgi:hypothetical protein